MRIYIYIYIGKTDDKQKKEGQKNNYNTESYKHSHWHKYAHPLVSHPTCIHACVHTRRYKKESITAVKLYFVISFLFFSYFYFDFPACQLRKDSSLSTPSAAAPTLQRVLHAPLSLAPRAVFFVPPPPPAARPPTAAPQAAHDVAAELFLPSTSLPPPPCHRCHLHQRRLQSPAAAPPPPPPFLASSCGQSLAAQERPRCSVACVHSRRHGRRRQPSREYTCRGGLSAQSSESCD
ncbi:hypothetical protein MOQ_008968 [Trypanosoma cruzi marinkellei]|uniref:Uncharacterized protein n=1 Tax=Trypanosoma cruzi marinkellei TaxID=85056 RepID=K2MJG4_TRYCR|nr:hypothetical protein MOQ_008968 [Trypanosoma cruzi marinkellei]